MNYHSVAMRDKDRAQIPATCGLPPAWSAGTAGLVSAYFCDLVIPGPEGVFRMDQIPCHFPLRRDLAGRLKPTTYSAFVRQILLAKLALQVRLLRQDREPLKNPCAERGEQKDPDV